MHKCFISFLTKLYVCNLELSHPIWQHKGAVLMSDILISFLVSVMANVVSYYVCKWLDRDIATISLV